MTSTLFVKIKTYALEGKSREQRMNLRYTEYLQ